MIGFLFQMYLIKIRCKMRKNQRSVAASRLSKLKTYHWLQIFGISSNH